MIRRIAPVMTALTLLLCTVHAAVAQDLEPTLERVAAAWHRADASGISGLVSKAGVSLDVDGGSVGPLAPRQAAAVLRRVFEDRESVSARVSMFRELANDRDRAFGEITWSLRARGTTQPQRATIFVGFVREGNAWKVNEIRLLR
jgi:predicted sugar kinase